VARVSYLIGAAFVAAALILGVHALVREDGQRAAPELPQGKPRLVDASSSAPTTAVMPLLKPPASLPLETPSPESVETSAEERRTPLTSDEVTLFDLGLHEDFARGAQWRVGLGHTDEGAAFPNDRVSAVEIPPGLQATLFDDVHGRGFKLTLGPGTHDLRPYAFDERVSSIEVSRYGQAVHVGPENCVVLYEHRGVDLGARGFAWRLELPRNRTEWTFLASRKEFQDDEASTAWVAQGFELVLFDDPGASGVALVLGPGLHELELLGFNDKASSARVRRVR
jgi:hypothetical protein